MMRSAGVGRAAGGAPLLEVEGLRVTFALDGGPLHAVRGLTLSVGRGETLALVGESGSGKSAAMCAVLRLLPRGAAMTADRLRLEGADLLALGERGMARLRGARIGMVFQDPTTALNPTMPVGRQIAEAAALHLGVGPRAARALAAEWLGRVGLGADRAADYPHRLSGGMRQRVAIAMALAGSPALLIADEPTAALDPTVGAQVLDLLADLQRQTGMGVVLVSHDLGVVARVADRVAVVHAGRVVEEGAVGALYRRPLHPYTATLLAAAAGEGGAEGAGPGARGGRAAGQGCAFAPRCAWAVRGCLRGEPPLFPAAGEPGRGGACWLLDPRAPAEVRFPGMVVADPPGGARTTRGGTEALGAGAVGGQRAGAGANAALWGEAEARAAGWGGPGGAGGSPGAPVRAAPGRRAPDHGSGRASRDQPLLEVAEVRRHFTLPGGRLVRAVDGVSVRVDRGEVYGLLGESGCGKTTLARVIARLLRPTSGSVALGAEDVHAARGAALGRLRRRMQIVFQNPYASLDPRMTVDEIVGEGLWELAAARRRPRVAEALEAVGLPVAYGSRLPHEFSGGQRQRIAIARALAVAPELLIADEPFSGLDAPAAAQIAALLGRLRRERGLTYVLIAHDPPLARVLADRVGVMYAGRLVETGAVDRLFARPAHPYTRALLDAVPVADPERERARPRRTLLGEAGMGGAGWGGCALAGRCPWAAARCREEVPALRAVAPGHLAACHFAEGAASDPDGAGPPAAPRGVEGRSPTGR